MFYAALVLSMPSDNAAARQRVWRALKAAGAGILRDGVYVMPERDECRATLAEIASDVLNGGGVAHVVRIEEPAEGDFLSLFDRTEAYADLINDVGHVVRSLSPLRAQDALRAVRKLRKAFIGLTRIDYFPGEVHRQADDAVKDLELRCARLLSPDEPQGIGGTISRLDAADYQGRIWATRARPWVDRLASAWLIRRCIDVDSKFLWLASPCQCPPNALGFDFDGAAFSHIDGKVTFEVLAESFAITDAAIRRIGQLVHFLDVGGAPAAEAVGVESILAGLRETIDDDDRLLEIASTIFDSLLTTFRSATPIGRGESP